MPKSKKRRKAKNKKHSINSEHKKKITITSEQRKGLDEANRILELATNLKYSKTINKYISYDPESKLFYPNLEAIANEVNNEKARLMSNTQYYDDLRKQGFVLSDITYLDS